MKKLTTKETKQTKGNHCSISSGSMILGFVILLLVFASYDKDSELSYIQKYFILAGVSTLITAVALYTSSKAQDKIEELALVAKQNESTNPTKVIDFEPMVHESNSKVEEKPRKTQKRPAFETASL